MPTHEPTQEPTRELVQQPRRPTGPVTRLLDVLARAFSFLPPKAFEILSGVLALLAFDVLRIRRRVVLANIARAFPELPDEKRRTMARSSYQSFGQTMCEFFASGRYFRDARMDILGEKPLRDALAAGRGAYIIVIHAGNWEFLCSRGTRHFAPVSVLAKDVGRGPAARWVTEMRQRNGCYVIARDGEVPATLRIPRILADNGIIGFVVDQHKPGGPRVPLFGTPAHTNSGLFQIWMRHKAPVIPAVAHRVGPNHHEMIFFPEFEVLTDPTWKFKETVLRNVEKMNLVVEEMIKTVPDQYFWLHKRWK